MGRRFRCVWLAVAGGVLGTALVPMRAQSTAARAAWLRYAIPPDPPRYHDLPHAVVLLGDGQGGAAPEEQTAADELDRGLGHMVAGTDVLTHRFDPRLDSIVLGTTEALRRSRVNRLPGWKDMAVPEEGFRIVHLRRGVRHWWVLQGGSPRAEMYAAFRFAALVAEDQQLPAEMEESPSLKVRAVEIDENPAELLQLLEKRPGEPLSDVFPRLLASTGINALVTKASDVERTRMETALRPFGIRLIAAKEGVPSSNAVTLLPRGDLVQFPPVHNGMFKADAESATGVLRRGDVDRVLRQPLFAANLYAFGRWAWKGYDLANGVAEEWARQTWGDDVRVYGVAAKVLLDSSRVYVTRTPLGFSSLADSRGVVAPAKAPPLQGTVPLSAEVVQQMYSQWFTSASVASAAVDNWETVRALVDAERFAAVERLLQRNSTAAEIAREVDTEWLMRTSGVPDALGFVGVHSGRTEAETMELQGFTVKAVPPEEASHGAMVVCAAVLCSATTVFHGEANVYRVEVGYFDGDVPAEYQLLVNGVARSSWSGEVVSGGLAPRRFVVNGVKLATGDRLEIRTAAKDGSRPAIDFVEVSRDPRWN